MPYKGLGSGIKRALEAWSKIDFVDDRDGCLFISTVHRDVAVQRGAEKSGEKSGEKTEEIILRLLAETPKMTINEISKILNFSTNAVEKQLAKLKREKRIERIGPNKGGYWEVR